MGFLNALLLFALSIFYIQPAYADNGSLERTNIVLVGATGDLSRKYLWQALFTLFVNDHAPNKVMTITAVSRDTEEKGTAKCQGYIDTRVKCDVPDIKKTLSVDECEAMKTKFSKAWQYKRGKKEEDFQALNTILSPKEGEKEVGRLFYLSVPPFAYLGLAKNIRTHCAPQEGTWLRVVLEKPFGHDLSSATKLADDLDEYLTDEEMYRVDHYLGKPGVTMIEEFRYANRAMWEGIWNKDHIERVEIVMKETDDVAGRTKFYNEYGVIRDVHQNHLTQIMTLIASELVDPSLESSSKHIQALKDNVLSDMRVIESSGAVLGQYDGYVAHVTADDEKVTESDVPTWASVATFIDNERWSGVPFIMTGGKVQDERRAYAKIIFKPDPLSARLCSRKASGCSNERVLLFNIQGGSLLANGKGGTFALSSPFLPPVSFPASFTPLEADQMLGTYANYHGASPTAGDAYTNLVACAYSGQKDRFVSTGNLMSSWKVWTPVLQAPLAMRVYTPDTLYLLDTVISANRMSFSSEVEGQHCSVHNKFRGLPLVSGPKCAVVEKLVDHLLERAVEAVTQRGVFHLVLPGGSTPLTLFDALILRGSGYPWQHTHVWMTDERCVDTTDKLSNSAMLEEHLIKVAPALGGLHLMSGACSASTSLEYQNDILQSVEGGRFDAVVLGIGGDGHTASLFPERTPEEVSLVQVVDPPTTMKPHVARMTLTHKALNQARDVSVLVLGSSKRKIVGLLDQLGATEHKQKLPIEQVVPHHNSGQMTWYIDNGALEA